jgi:hypothetical protein
MTWPTISAADLNDYKVAAMIEALRTAALDSGQADPFDTVMHDRCNYVRARLSSISLSATAYSVPPELKTCVCWLIIEAMQSRLPGLSLTEEDRRMIDRAYKDLDLAAAGSLPITLPDDAITPSVQAGTSPAMQSKTLNYTRDDQDGI